MMAIRKWAFHYFIFGLIIGTTVCTPFVSWASKARIEALGGDETARFYFYDSRNAFINPASINQMKDFILFEWGEDTDKKEVNAANPKAEGGIVKMGDAFVYGLYLGRDEGYEFRNQVAGQSDPAFLYQDNSVELLVGGNAGLYWGSGVKYSYSQDDQSGFYKKQASLDISLGIGTDVWDLYGKSKLFDYSKGGQTTSEEFKNNLSVEFGASYRLNEWVPHIMYAQDGYEYMRSQDGKLDMDGKSSRFVLGVGQSIAVDEKTKMLVDVSYDRKGLTSRSTIVDNPQSTKLTYWKLPIILGIESEVKDWLTLRGSITQNLYSNYTNTQSQGKTERSTTKVAAGATFILAKIKLDGLLGTTDGTGQSNQKGVLSLANLMTRVSLSYWF